MPKSWQGSPTLWGKWVPATELCHVGADQTLLGGQLADLPLWLVQRPDSRILPVGIIAELDVPPEVPDSPHFKVGAVDHNLKAQRDTFVACELSYHAGPRTPREPSASSGPQAPLAMLPSRALQPVTMTLTDPDSECETGRWPAPRVRSVTDLCPTWARIPHHRIERAWHG